ncbi:MAG TPA: VOC family protein [Aggregatilineales bacterium]|nr:VOC family protein [Aggregatilineales bacterium]
MAIRSITYLEIPATDREKAANFYSELFGWGIEHFGPPMNYTTFTLGNEKLWGGFPNVDDTMKVDDVLIYIGSDDIGADLKEIVKKGGKVLRDETEVPGYGSFAFFTDPTGNRIGLWKNAPATKS